MTGQINPCMYIVLLPSYLFLQFRISVSVLASVISNQSSYLHFVCQGQRHETVAVWLKARGAREVLASGLGAARIEKEVGKDSSLQCLNQCY